MARTLYLENGSTEYIFAGETEADKLQQIIHENLGRDCEELYEEVLAERRGENGDNYEKIADGYRGMAVDTMNDLHIEEYAMGHKSNGTFTASYKCGCDKCKIYFTHNSEFTLEHGQPKFICNGYETVKEMWNRRADND